VPALAERKGIVADMIEQAQGRIEGSCLQSFAPSEILRTVNADGGRGGANNMRV
jgi:hypothetical protein